MRKQKEIPNFKNSSEEDAFWQKHDSADYIDWSKAKRTVFSNLKPSNRIISLPSFKSVKYDHTN